MVIGGTNDIAPPGDMRVTQRDWDRYRSGVDASRSAGLGDRDYMAELGRAGIERQQEQMRDTADAADRVRRVVKRAPPRTAGRK
jgi:hypothetical protein